MNVDVAIKKALENIDSDTVTRLAVDLVSIPSRTGEEQAVAEYLVDYLSLIHI